MGFVSVARKGQAAFRDGGIGLVRPQRREVASSPPGHPVRAALVRAEVVLSWESPQSVGDPQVPGRGSSLYVPRAPRFPQITPGQPSDFQSLTPTSDGRQSASRAGVSYGVSNGTGFVSNGWTVTALRCLRASAHGSSFFLHLMESVWPKPASQLRRPRWPGWSALTSEATCARWDLAATAQEAPVAFTCLFDTFRAELSCCHLQQEQGGAVLVASVVAGGGGQDEEAQAAWMRGPREPVSGRLASAEGLAKKLRPGQLPGPKSAPPLGWGVASQRGARGHRRTAD